VKNLLTGGMTREENKKRSGTEEEDEGWIFTYKSL
jgi:hypothetical protein